jgi:hypothetical protein
MDMGLGMCNVKSMYMADSLMTVVKDISKYKLDLVEVQEVRWDRGGTEPAGEYTATCLQNARQQLGKHISAVSSRQ